MPGQVKFSVSDKDGIVWHDSPKMKDLKKDRNAEKAGKLIDKSQKAPVAPEHVQKRVQERMEGDMQSSVRIWVDNIAPSLKAGEVLGEPVDHSYTWLVVKMKEVRKSAAGNSYRLEAIEVPKDNFETWLQKEKDNVKVQ